MTQRILVALTLINLGLGLFLMSQLQPAEAQDVAPVLRGRALEIVDELGNVRASITVNAPATVAGRDYAESVLLRLSGKPGPAGGPTVKLEASGDGSGLRLADGRETGIDVSAKAAGSLLRITNADGRTQLIRP